MKDATPSPVIQVVCAIIRHPEDRSVCLAAQRALNDKNLPGLWEFPGGKIETGESAEQALVREIREELLIDIEVQSPLTPTVYHYETLSIRLIPFICDFKNGEIHAVEHAATRWISKSELNSLNWAPADLPIVHEWHQL